MKRVEKKGFLGGITKVYNFDSETTAELEKGGNVVIEYSHESNRYILVSSNENMKILDSSFNTNELIDMIVTPTYEEKYKYVYIGTTNKTTLIKYFLTKFPYASKTNLKLYVDTDIQNYLDKYGPDSLFMRMSSHSTDFIFNVFYVYGLKEFRKN